VLKKEIERIYQKFIEMKHNTKLIICLVVIVLYSVNAATAQSDFEKYKQAQQQKF
jgi:hypothetical protein